MAQLEAESRGDMDRVKTAVARREATASLGNLLKSLAKAGEVARKKEVCVELCARVGVPVCMRTCG